MGATAPQAADKIHTDFVKGFIRTQTIVFEDFITYKGEQGAKETGKMRAEGKDYIIKDGDVMNFLFNLWVVFNGKNPRLGVDFFLHGKENDVGSRKF